MRSKAVFFSYVHGRRFAPQGSWNEFLYVDRRVFYVDGAFFVTGGVVFMLGWKHFRIYVTGRLVVFSSDL